MQPINYSVDVATPFQAALQGYQAGAAIRGDQQAQAQQQAALAEQQRQKQMLADLASKPNATADDYASVMTQIPALAEHLGKAWAAKNTAQQQSLASDLLQWGAAIKSGRPEVAVDQMTGRADMIEKAAGSPTKESEGLRMQAKVIKEHPTFALGQFQAMLAANPNGKDAAATLASFGGEGRAAELHPDLVTKGAADAKKAGSDALKAGSDATTAAVTAKYAEPVVLAELAKKGWDVQNIKSEIGYRKESNRIAAMSAAAAREGNALKREELGIKIKEARSAMEDKIRAKVADAETAAGTIDNMLNTVDRLKKSPGLREVVGSIEGSDFYPTQGAAALNLLNPFTSSGDDRADAIAMIKTLGSQTFLAMVPQLKGTGNLSDAEGKKLETGLQSLSRQQSEKQFVDNLDEVQRLMLKARKNIETRTGLKLKTPDTPAAAPSAAEIDALVKKHGG